MADDAKGAEGAPSVPDEAGGLKAKNQELLGEIKALKNKLRAFDFDPETAKEALEFKERAEQEMAEKRGEFEKLRQKEAAKYQRDLEAKTAREAKLVQALERRLVENELSKAIREAQGDPKYLVPIARPRVKAVEGERDWETVVYDDKPSTMDELVKEMQREYPRAFDGTGASGSGTSPGAHMDKAPATTDPWELGRLADLELRRRKAAAKR